MDASNLPQSAPTAVSRRAFLVRMAAVAAGLPLLAACAPTAPSRGANQQASRRNRRAPAASRCCSQPVRQPPPRATNQSPAAAARRACQ